MTDRTCVISIEDDIEVLRPMRQSTVYDKDKTR